jgi:hypothetical protein
MKKKKLSNEQIKILNSETESIGKSKRNVLKMGNGKKMFLPKEEKELRNWKKLFLL